MDLQDTVQIAPAHVAESAALNKHRATVLVMSDEHLIEAFDALEDVLPASAWRIIRDEVQRRGL